MNIASLVFLQHASDILTELINDVKLSPYRAYLIEISTNIQDIHKKFSRLKINGIDDEICEHTDNTLKYITQLQVILQQQLVTKVKYSDLKNACKFFSIVILVDYSYAMYKRQPNEKKYYKDNFEKLKKSIDNMLQKYDCLLDNKTLNLSVPQTDIAFKSMCIYIEQVMIEKRKLKTKN